MSSISLKSNPAFEYGEVILPTSKSLSNRALIIRELCDKRFDIGSLSDSDDTQNLIECLAHSHSEMNVGAAGSNMRFLISLLSMKPGTHILTGDNRMQKRPVAELVSCLRTLGAKIEYVNEEGFPPLQITGSVLTGGKLKINGNVSSQFISSLLMIAPRLKHGMEIEIIPPLVSEPYVKMTMMLMKYFGVECRMGKNIIQVASQQYYPKDYEVEADWSCAAFWYGLVANSTIGTEIFLKNIRKNNLQGDQKSIEYFKHFGVRSTEKDNGILIRKIEKTSNHLSFDLINEPDLFPVLAYCAAALKLKASFSGLQTLNLKESNRIEATRVELEKTGAICDSGENYFNITQYNNQPTNLVFDVHADHRLAMAATVFLFCSESITIQDKEVVSKSYPAFWEALQHVGIANIY